jgi:cytochrome b561
MPAVTDRSEVYRPMVRALHWLTAILVVATIPVGTVMVREGLPRGIQDGLYIFHKNVGVILILLVLLRLIYRAAHPPPPLPLSMPDWQRNVAVLTHWLLYALLIAMGVSGYIRVVAGGFPIETLDALGFPPLAPRSDALAETAKAVHFYVRFALVALIALHVGAALRHLFSSGDGVFARMWPAAGRSRP